MSYVVLDREPQPLIPIAVRAGADPGRAAAVVALEVERAIASTKPHPGPKVSASIAALWPLVASVPTGYTDPMHPIDQCHKLLHLLGWSPGETAWRYPDGSGTSSSSPCGSGQSAGTGWRGQTCSRWIHARAPREGRALCHPCQVSPWSSVPDVPRPAICRKWDVVKMFDKQPAFWHRAS